MTSAERQKKFRELKEAQGLKPLTIFLPPEAFADFQLAAQLINADRALELRNLRDTRSGRIRSLRR